jgi:phosphoglycerate dehydrogenase-like enzyme
MGAGMLLGDVIVSFEDPACAGEALLALDDLALTAAIAAAADEEEMTAGEFAMQSVEAFVDGASDERWLTLIGLMSRADNPGQVFLRRILSDVLATRAAG